jgi:SEC-C motif-containing protein
VMAKRAWCLEQAHRAQVSYLDAFGDMKAGRFYEAWCALETAELILHSLDPHGKALWKRLHLDFIDEYVVKWQSLFPYKMFLSPEIVEEEVVCSICRKILAPRRPCGHTVGEIYGGKMCLRIVTKMQPLGVALVANPVQKYSVIFAGEGTDQKSRDHYNYGLVRYAIAALRNPFDKWDAERSVRRQPHTYFRDVGRNDPCPCDSKKKYKKCCLLVDGVLRPHVEFRFAVPPPVGTPERGFVQ